MLKNFRQSLLFNILTSFSLLCLAFSPCNCIAEDTIDDLGKTSNSHDCCDKADESANTSTNTKSSNCETCDNCVISKDCTDDFSASLQTPNFSHENSVLIATNSINNLLFNTTTKLFTDPSPYPVEQFSLVKSSATLSILFGRWLI